MLYNRCKKGGVDMYEEIHTAQDVMREYLIQGANLDKYGVPELYPINISPSTDSCDFGASFDCRIKNHRKLNVNFYVNDNVFERLWNNTDRYVKHLKCFHSVIAPDFSISTGRNRNRADINRGRRKLPVEQKYESGLPKSGITGITWNSSINKWQVNYKKNYVGVYETVEEAAQALEEYKKQNFIEDSK